MKNTTLKMLTISCNDLSNAGIATISEAFQLNTTLTELRMHKCGLSEGGAYVVCVIQHLAFKVSYRCTVG